MGKILELKDFAKEHHIPILLDESSSFIKEYIVEHDVHSILEIGTASGYSAICFASVKDDVVVTTIEKDINRYTLACDNVKNFNLQDRIIIINADALDCTLDDTYDLIFIDAAKSQYIKFFEKYKHNLCPGGAIISDNLSFHGMVEDPTLTHNRNTRQLVGKIRKYIDFLKDNPEYDTTFYRIGDGLSVTTKKSD